LVGWLDGWWKNQEDVEKKDRERKKECRLDIE